MSTCCTQEIVLLYQMDGSVMYALLKSMYFLYRYTQYGLSHKAQSRLQKGFNVTLWLFYAYSKFWPTYCPKYVICIFF